MANDPQKRSLLDQLTDSATQPPPGIPAPLAPAASGDSFVPPPLSSASAATPGSTANLESLAASPSTLAANVDATKQSAENAKDENPGFLAKLGRLAGGAVGLESPNSSPQANLGSKIGGVIGRAGAGLALAAGTPEQKQLAEEQLQMPLKVAQIQNEREWRQGMLGINQQNANTKGTVAATGAKTEQDKYAQGDDAMGLPRGTVQRMADAAATNAASNEQLRDAHTRQIEASLNGQVHVMPQIAHIIGRDDLADKDVSPIQYQQQVANVLKSLNIKNQDLGDEGVWGTSPLTGRITRLGDSPSMAANQRYMNRPVAVFNPETQQIEYTSGGQAVAQHMAPAGPAQQIMSKQAQFSDIYSGLGAMRAAINGISQEPLDAATIGKLTLASRETDPTVYHQAIDTILGTEQLTPAQQDFIIAQRQLEERAMSLRNLAGMGNASDQLRAAIRATLPSAKSGDVTMMRKQLDAVTNLVDNLHTGVPSINTGVPKNGTTAPNSSAGKTLTLQEAQSYLQKAGGDANKARALAKKDGRSF